MPRWIMEIENLLRTSNLKFDFDSIQIEQVKHEEDNDFYDVWKIISGGNAYILKRTDKYEPEIYSKLLSGFEKNIPKLHEIKKKKK